jgi:hypothetical protein
MSDQGESGKKSRLDLRKWQNDISLPCEVQQSMDTSNSGGAAMI